MSSTTVHSKNQNENHTTSVAGSAFVATEKTLEIPPKGQVYEVISNYVEEQGNIEIPVGNAKLQENGILQMENGANVAMANPKAYQAIVENKRRREEMEIKAEATERANVGSER